MEKLAPAMPQTITLNETESLLDEVVRVTPVHGGLLEQVLTTTTTTTTTLEVNFLPSNRVKPKKILRVICGICHRPSCYMSHDITEK